MKERIAYKVVDYEYESICVEQKKYKRKYKIGEIIKAEPNSFGLFCFDNLNDAQSFYYRNDNKFLKVRPIGRGVKVKIAAGDFDSIDITRFYKKYWKLFGRMFSGKKFNQKTGQLEIRTINTPTGTVCYPSVEVLNEINFHGDIIK